MFCVIMIYYAGMTRTNFYTGETVYFPNLLCITSQLEHQKNRKDYNMSGKPRTTGFISERLNTSKNISKKQPAVEVKEAYLIWEGDILTSVLFCYVIEIWLKNSKLTYFLPASNVEWNLK